MIKPEFKLDKRFKNRIGGRFQRYLFETGVEDARHRNPRRPRAHGTLQGGPIRKMGPDVHSTNKKIAVAMHVKTGFMTKPFHKKTSKDLRAFFKAFFDLAAGKVGRSKVESLLRAVVRNPMLRGEYGRNTRARARVKGFNRLLFDTGQLFKAIKAKVRTRRVQK